MSDVLRKLWWRFGVPDRLDRVVDYVWTTSDRHIVVVEGSDSEKSMVCMRQDTYEWLLRRGNNI